jgi:hypothetical protein
MFINRILRKLHNVYSLLWLVTLLSCIDTLVLQYAAAKSNNDIWLYLGLHVGFVNAIFIALAALTIYITNPTLSDETRNSYYGASTICLGYLLFSFLLGPVINLFYLDYPKGTGKSMEFMKFYQSYSLTSMIMGIGCLLFLLLRITIVLRKRYHE